jgi:hypothetical protein
MRTAERAERLVYRIAGLPVALGTLLGFYGGAGNPLRSAFAHRYWHPDGLAEWTELLGAMVLWPIALLVACAWFTGRNGAVIRRRHGKGVVVQLAEQLRLYFAAGLLAPWYYIFSLHDDGKRRAPSFISRFETKTCYFRLLKTRKGSPLNDKRRFAEYCAEHGLRCIATLLSLNGNEITVRLPDQDVFVKPRSGRGGRGAERWDRLEAGRFSGPSGQTLSSDELAAHLLRRSRDRPLIVQPRMRPHRELQAVTSGALPTTRILTCLNERGDPEVMAAMLRTSFGENRTVDNLHAGGIGALVHVASGVLSKASDLGSDASLGWFSAHPDTGAPIEGRRLPFWHEAKALALAAHRCFADRVAIGWDIAILEDGPILVEGNGNPDLDILQRFMRIGFRDHRFGELLGHHLSGIGAVPKPRASARPIL